MIVFTAQERYAFCRSNGPITTGSIGLPVHFVFDDEWDELQKIVTFTGSGQSADVILDRDCNTTVPPQCLTQVGGTLTIGVRGAKPDGTIVIPTIVAVAGNIYAGSMPGSVDPFGPAPDWTAQVQQAIEDAIDALEEETGRAEQSKVSAEEAATLAESWAVGGTGTRLNEDYDNSKFYAQVAQQGAAQSGYAYFYTDPNTGEIIVTVADNLNEDIRFEINEITGEMEVEFL